MHDCNTPDNHILFNGQTLNRTTYAALWDYVSDNSLTGGSSHQYGVGNGSTTFTVPDWRDKYLIGARSGGDHSLGSIVGIASQNISHSHIVGGETASVGGLLAANKTVGADGLTGEAVGTLDNRPPSVAVNYVVYAGAI